jgi:hypothetical protein
MEGFANVVSDRGPYDLPPELHYLRPPPPWPTDSARSQARKRSQPVAVKHAHGAAQSNATRPSSDATASPALDMRPRIPSAGIAVQHPPGGPKLLVRVRAAI